MTRSRHQKDKGGHYAVLVNQHAGTYSRKAVTKLLESLKKRGCYYSIYEPDSAMAMLRQSMQVIKSEPRKDYRSGAPQQRGAITGLIACGGDGTFNLVARAALQADLPVGCLPLGAINNIAQTLYGTTDIDKAIEKIVAGNYRKLDVGQAADQMFFGSIALGFIPQMQKILTEQKMPRFGFGWSQLGAKAASAVKLVQTTIKIDAFRFEVSPVILNVNLLPNAAGIPFSPASLPDDGLAEIIFDMGTKIGEFSSITRNIIKGKYLFGNEIRLYRGRDIMIQPTKDRVLYLDGELIPLPTNVLTIKIGEKQVKAFCA